MPTPPTAKPSLPSDPRAPNAERIPVQVYDASEAVAGAAAGIIAELIRRNSAAGRQTVLGLATGSTPLSVYEALIRLHRQEGLSFRPVVTFNLDEYYPMRPE